MGSMGQRKRRRTRSDAGGRRVNIEQGVSLGPFEPEHHPYTIEGGLEMQQAFLDGVRRARGWKHVVGMFLVAILLLPLVIAFAIWLIHLA